MIDDADTTAMQPAELVRWAEGRALMTVVGSPRALAPHEHPVLALFARYTSRRSLDTVRRTLNLAAGLMVGEVCTAQAFPWWRLRRTHMLRLRGLLAERYAPATCNKVLTIVRQALLESLRALVISADDYERAVDVDPVDGSRVPPGRSIGRDELVRMEAVCDASTPLGVRDLALIRALEQTGIRRDESTKLDLASYSRASDVLRVMGKGNKERDVHVNRPLREALTAWIAIRGEAPGPLFHPASPSGVIQFARRLSYGGMQSAVAKIAERAGVSDISMHDFRRTLIGNLLDQGTDIATVASIVGHASVNTTAKYDRRGARAAKEALERHGERGNDT